MNLAPQSFIHLIKDIAYAYGNNLDTPDEMYLRLENPTTKPLVIAKQGFEFISVRQMMQEQGKETPCPDITFKRHYAQGVENWEPYFWEVPVEDEDFVQAWTENLVLYDWFFNPQVKVNREISVE
jgi:hypothetical protein